MATSPMDADSSDKERSSGSLPRARLVAMGPVLHGAEALTRDAQYRVSFAIERPPSETLTAEGWSRAIFEGAPIATRCFLIIGWLALSLRIRPRRSAGRVLGWPIAREDPEMVVLVVPALLGLTSCNVVSIDRDRITLSSFVRYTGSMTTITRAAWAVTRPIHELVLPHLMTSAVHRCLRH
jgi:hypothetical protein